MKHVKRTGLQKKYLLLIVLGAILVLLVGAYFIVRAVTGKEPEPTSKIPPVVDREIGEAVVNGESAAYAWLDADGKETSIESAQFTFIEITRPLGEGGVPNPAFGFLRSDDGYFILFVDDEYGHAVSYVPAIVEEDASFTYDQLYATDQYGSFGAIPKILYLCTALGAPYFEERIPLAESAEERTAQLARFGLTDGERTAVSFAYLDAAGQELQRTLLIGGHSVSGGGYYFMVGGRDYIYYTASNTFDYATAAPEDFINPRIIAEGLARDNAFEPYLTPRFEQYRNTLHQDEGEALAENAEATVRARTITSVPVGSSVSPANNDGYLRDNERTLTFLLQDRVWKVLKGQTVGTIGTPEEPFYLTLRHETRLLDFDDRETIEAEYQISKIEAILTDEGEIRAAGQPVGDHTLLLVGFTCTMNGEDLSLHELSNGIGTVSLPMHALIDLTNEALPDAAKDALRAAAIGNVDVAFSISYTKESTAKRTIGILLSEIVSIFDENAKPQSVAEEGSFVTYSYYTVIDGVRGDLPLYATVRLGEGDDAFSAAIQSALAGKTTGAYANLSLYSYTGYRECLDDFVTYEISQIHHFVTSEQVVGFAFVNSSERDPFYGETFFQNTMETSYRLYGLNTSSCEAVVRKLGGLGTSSTSSLGITGTKTVAVGLSEEVFLRYGLYDYTVIFTLPRGIVEKAGEGIGDDSGKPDSLSDYSFHGTLTFTLRVSKKQYDPESNSFIRYVASDMFNLVAKVNADDFLFLDYDFEHFYARRSLIMMDIANVASIRTEFSMDDFTGNYLFRLTHNERYVVRGTDSIDTYDTREDVPEGADASLYDFINVFVTPSGECTPTALLAFLEEKGDRPARLPRRKRLYRCQPARVLRQKVRGH